MADTLGAAELGALLLRQAADLLNSLDDDQIAGLVSGRSRLGIVTAEPAVRPDTPAVEYLDAEFSISRDTATDLDATPSRHAKRSKPARSRVSVSAAASAGTGRRADLPGSFDVDVIRGALREAPSRRDAEDIVASLGKITVSQLRALGSALGVEGITARDAKAAVIRKIVDGTTGLRLRSAAMFGGEQGT